MLVMETGYKGWLWRLVNETGYEGWAGHKAGTARCDAHLEKPSVLVTEPGYWEDRLKAPGSEDNRSEYEVKLNEGKTR